MVAAAESCTGGLIAALLTEIAGASAVFERGFVTYSNVAKTDSLGVPAALISTYGAVSAEVAEAMAKGALKKSKAQMSVAITGIAGPGGGTKTKPVGLVYIAVAGKKGKPQAKKYNFKGSRHAIRNAGVIKALDMLREYLTHFS